MEVTTAVLIIIASVIASIVDTSLGMCYGTILTPLLLICGYIPIEIVPVVLISQLIVDIVGGSIHTMVNNFTKGDIKPLARVAIPATILAAGGALLNIKLPKTITTIYIIVLVLILGLSLIYGLKFLDGNGNKLIALSSVAGLNKGFMGGGFGPMVVSGQIITNHDVKPSIAIGDIAEAPVCISALIIYFIFSTISIGNLLMIVTIPAIIGALIGPHVTVKLNDKRQSEKILGSSMLILGIYLISKLVFL